MASSSRARSRSSLSRPGLSLAKAQHRCELAPFARVQPARLLVDLLAGDHALDGGESGLREMRAAQAILHEGVVADRAPALQRVQHDVGIDADFVLRMRIGA